MLVLYKDQNKSATLFLRVKYAFQRNLLIVVSIYWLVIEKNQFSTQIRAHVPDLTDQEKFHRIAYETRIGK